MKPPPLHGLAAVAALQGVAAAAARPEPEAAAPARRKGGKRPLSTTPEAVRQRRCQARKRAAAKGAAEVSSVISSVIDHAQDHAQDHAPRVVDLDLDLKSTKNTSRDLRTPEITPRGGADGHEDRLSRRRLYAGFAELLREADLDYPQPASFLEQKAARELLAENHVDDVLRAAKQLVREWRRGDEWTRQNRPATLAYLRRHVVELLHRAPKPRPAAPAAPQLELVEIQEGPQPRIFPGAAARGFAELRAASPEFVKAELDKLRSKGLR